MTDQIGLEPEQVLGLVSTIILCLLIGWEREENRATDKVYIIGGVRTFPIIGLIGYGITLVSEGNPIGPAVGLAAVSAFLLVSYLHKLRDADHGGTTELAALLVYVVGVLVGSGLIWVAASLTVATVLLLHAKAPLENLATGIDRREIATLVQFLLLAVVILPALPNEEYTRFDLNPFTTWLVVVVVSGISYVSYVIQRLMRGRRSELLSAVLGGTYSSTATTVVLAKRSHTSDDTRLYVGAITLASSVMYLRVAILLALFNAELAWALSMQLAILALIGSAVGYGLATFRRETPAQRAEADEGPVRNPLEIWAAVTFAVLFTVVTVATRLVTESVGKAGLYALALLTGVTDVDAMILSLTQTAGSTSGPALHVAVVAILLAMAGNNVAKGVYALMFGRRAVGFGALVALVALAALSLVALIGTT
ncbi:MAG: MgtC/SapB family protein [Armatimonadetes bacterium]|nr:MgtC/SapB family protein [Armatimonadota bacterium]